MFYECKACKTTLRALEDSCCVYCSYGNVLCPSAQQKSGRHALLESFRENKGKNFNEGAFEKQGRLICKK